MRLSPNAPPIATYGRHCPVARSSQFVLAFFASPAGAILQAPARSAAGAAADERTGERFNNAVALKHYLEKYSRL